MTTKRAHKFIPCIDLALPLTTDPGDVVLNGARQGVAVRHAGDPARGLARKGEWGPMRRSKTYLTVPYWVTRQVSRSTRYDWAFLPNV